MGPELRGRRRLGADGDDPPGIREAGERPAAADQGLLTHVPAGVLREASKAGGPEPVPSYRGTVEEPERGKTGICCSGGGIRSAAFNLGALQVLHEAKELPKARYLAAVSGGSYICAAYSIVGKHWRRDEPPKGPDDPGWDDSNPELFDGMAPFARNSPEEQYLRNRSSYMAPDGWAKLYLGIRAVLGLVFNVLFLALPVFGVTVLAGLVLYAPQLTKLRGSCTTDCTFQPSVFAWGVPAVVALVALGVALVRVVRTAPSEEDRRWSEWLSTRLLVIAAAIAVATLALPALVNVAQGTGKSASVTTEAARTGTTGGAGLLGLVAGLLGALREALSTPKKVAATAGVARERFAKLSGRARRALVHAAATLAGPLMVLAVAVFALTVVFNNYKPTLGPWWLWLLGFGAIGAFVVIYASIDITSLSLHPFYKRRLCTAFALKRVKPENVSPERDAAGAPQEQAEGVALERDYERLVTLSETALDDWPCLLVCAAANISDTRVTPPGRPVTSFTFSANTVGGPLVGALETKRYEKTFLPDGSDSGRVRDFSLPAAVAMSGAALAPSMGKSATRAFTFLLTLANLRLGVWVPNPRWVAGIEGPEDKQLRRYGRPRPLYLVREMIGRNTIDAKYLYVSDGGHYENLGLVELLRRGCTRVFCFDASGGPVGGELGDAVALARSELGVEIQIDPTPLNPEGDPPTAKQDTVTGKLKYPGGTDGTIVYARNVISPGEPWDVRAHQLEDPRFPHDSTLDQLYTDQKFESYRRLGEEAARHAVARMRQESPRDGAGEMDRELSPEAVREMLDRGTIQLVDVRDRFGHDLVRIAGALHIAFAEIPEHMSELHREHPVVCHCEEGERSRRTAGALRGEGFDAYYMAGGIRAWIDSQLPVERNASG